MEMLNTRLSKILLTKSVNKYLELIASWDIETSKIEYKDGTHAFMYIWQLHIWGMPVIYGRTWEDFITMIDELNRIIPEKKRLIIYVHNLAHEFQFLKGIHEFDRKDVFLVDVREPLYCVWGKVEFRCSYKLAGTGLERFMKDMNVPKALQKTEMNYDVVRYPWTEIETEDLIYMRNDVVGLSCAIKALLKANGDTLNTIPYTSTGYVRRMAKKVLFPYNGILRGLVPTLHVFELLREAFRGGDTHANRFYAGKILENVGSYDRESSYPYELVNKKFPLTEFRETTDDIKTILPNSEKFGYVFRVRLEHVELKKWHQPYISFSKCRNIKNYLLDNGRILYAESLETTLTEIDLMILLEDYNIASQDITIIECYKSLKRYLPLEFRQLVIDLFIKKTELKGGQDNIAYAESKKKINALYGMTVQNTLKDDIAYLSSTDEYYLIDTKEEKLAKMKRSPFLPYAVGVWVTAYARQDLKAFMWIVGRDFVYADTDSVKYIGNYTPADYNNRMVAEAQKLGYKAVDIKGVTHYMGVYENEGISEKFVTLGAKKYAQVKDGELKVTVAGVNKNRKGSTPSGAEELGDIEKFKEGFIWSKAGGTRAIYNDNDTDIDLQIDGHNLHISSNVAIVPTTYKLSTSIDIEEILKRISNSSLEWLRKNYFDMEKIRWTE